MTPTGLTGLYHILLTIYNHPARSEQIDSSERDNRTISGRNLWKLSV
jgi:hypothetical protein